MPGKDDCKHLWDVVEETDEGTYMACRFNCGATSFVPKSKGGGK